MKEKIASKWIITVLFLIVLGGCSQDNFKGQEEKNKSEDAQLIRQTEFGKVKGKKEGNVLIWLGIPYGADTSGSARWKAPQDPTKWEKELDTTKAGEVFLQADGEDVMGSENALNLDIYRKNDDKENLPVMVYVHGGNNQTGKAGEISGESFVDTHDAVVVSVNYRLGPLGFNPLPSLKLDEDQENSSGNYGLLNLNKSLEWVRQNIASFGGDAKNVTVVGFSAGGRDVMAMLISPIFADKFDKAISLSGGMTIADEAKSQEVFANAIAPLVVEDKVKENEEVASEWLMTSSSEVKEYLYNISGECFVTLMRNAGIRMSVFPHLFSDGYVLPKEGFATSDYNAVPLMMVTGQQEFSLFARFDPYFSEAVKEGTLDTEENTAKEYQFVNHYGGKLYSFFNVQESAEKMSTHYKAPIYGMEILFGNNPTVVGEKMGDLGSFHRVVIPLLDTKNQNYSPFVGDAYTTDGAKELSQLFQQYIYQFMSSGNPNTQGLTQWEQWQRDRNNLLFLDASDSAAFAKMGQKEEDYTTILNGIANDQTLTPDRKNEFLSHVMNGRWFSQELDEHYDNVGDFYR